MRARLRDFAKSADRAARADTRWSPLASALDDTQAAVEEAGRPGADTITLMSRVEKDEATLTKACTIADSQDGWGHSVYVPSGAMEPTVDAGDWIEYQRPPSLPSIRRGSIILFTEPRSWAFSGPTERFLKRVIGLAGDHVVCCDRSGRITVNGIPLHETYLYPGSRPSDFPFEVRVPDGYLWVMGDHRNASADSRAHITDGHEGCIPIRDVVGVATRIIAPSARAAVLTTPTYEGL